MMFEAERDPQRSETSPARYYGKYAGLVIDNEAPEGGAHRGQLKVRVPGILEETPDGGSSQPIEVLATPSFPPGFFFIPERDAQVWVEFVAGDINFPLWTGAWYPADATPKNTEGQDPTEKQKLIRTAAGHVVQFDDTSDGEKIVIKDGKSGNLITLDSNGTTLEHPDGGARLLLKKDGTVRIEAKNIELAADQNIELKAGQNIKLEAVKVDVSVTDAMEVS